MKTSLCVLLAISLSSISMSSCMQEEKKEVETKVGTMIEEVDDKPLLRHVVLFKFKDESTSEDIASIERAFVNLSQEIPEIHSLEWGENNSPENLNDGLTHCFFLTFKSEEDRAVYLPHPAHKSFGELLGPHLDKVTVVDYWTK